MENIEKDIEKIKKIISEVKPQFTVFGGDIHFAGVNNRTVQIKPTGYCYR